MKIETWNHPNPEQWMSYLYEELNADDRAHLKAHLQTCPDCAAKLTEWQSARKNLDAWRLPRAPKRVRAAFALPVFRWAAAAVVFLCAGFAVGRMTSFASNLEKARATMEPELRRQLLGEYEAKRAQDNKLIYATLAKLESQHDADIISLKKELDTVAVNTDASLRTTEQQLMLLADSAPPARNPRSPSK